MTELYGATAPHDGVTAHSAAVVAPAAALQAARPEAPALAGREAAISVRDLHMAYGTYEAVQGIDLEVAHGEILAFLGPNGAGKTTTVEILEGFRQRTSGEVRVLGADPAQARPGWRARIGVVLQSSTPERLLTVRECLTMYAGYYPKPLTVDHALDLVGLAEKAGSRCDQLSGGQQRRLDVALALIGDPELIFLDEPTTGFDPSARHLAWDVVRGLRDLGKTIFLTTHFMDEAEQLADRIIILSAGRIVASGTPEAIGGRETEASVISFTMPAAMTAESLPALPVPVSVDGHRRAEITAPEPMPVLNALSAWAMQHDLPLADIAVQRPSLEDVYLRLTREDS